MYSTWRSDESSGYCDLHRRCLTGFSPEARRNEVCEILGDRPVKEAAGESRGGAFGWTEVDRESFDGRYGRVEAILRVGLSIQLASAERCDQGTSLTRIEGLKKIQGGVKRYSQACHAPIADRLGRAQGVASRKREISTAGDPISDNDDSTVIAAGAVGKSLIVRGTLHL